MHVLLLDTNRQRIQQIKRSLSEMRYMVDVFTTHDVALTRLERGVSRYDIILVHTAVDGADTAAWCATVRRSGITTPIIALSGSQDALLAARVLFHSADDFIKLPVRAIELVARMQTVARRAQEIKPPTKTVGNLTLDVEQRVASVDGVPLKLSNKEFLLLEYLASHADTVVTREQLLGYGWDVPDGVVSNTLDAHIKNIRRKLSPDAGCSLLTVRGIGYRLTASS